MTHLRSDLRGAVGATDTDSLKYLASLGVNAIRTYTTENASAVLRDAGNLGMTGSVASASFRPVSLSILPGASAPFVLITSCALAECAVNCARVWIQEVPGALCLHACSDSGGCSQGPRAAERAGDQFRQLSGGVTSEKPVSWPEPLPLPSRMGPSQLTYGNALFFTCAGSHPGHPNPNCVAVDFGALHHERWPEHAPGANPATGCSLCGATPHSSPQVPHAR